MLISEIVLKQQDGYWDEGKNFLKKLEKHQPDNIL